MIRRGDIYLIDFNPARGSEQAGLRPALIIQNNIGNRFSPTTIVAAITKTNLGKYPFVVKLNALEGGLSYDSFINLSQILTIDKTRLIRKIGNLQKNKMNEVDQAIKISLGID